MGHASVVDFEVTCGQIVGVNRTNSRVIQCIDGIGCLPCWECFPNINCTSSKIGKSDGLAYPVPRSAADPSSLHTANNGAGAVKNDPEALPRGATKMACSKVQ